jgi:6-phosphogluconolactonase
MSRREFLQASSAAALGGASWTGFAGSADERLLFVGTQTSEAAGASKGIYAYSFNSTTGALRQIGLAVAAENPTFLALTPDKRTLVAVNELDEFEGKKAGGVESFVVDARAMTLKKVNQVSSGGSGPCHVNVDHTGKCAFAANYGEGCAASYRLSHEGRLSEAVSVFHYTGSGPKVSQEKARGHRVTPSPDNRFLLVNDLGSDRIHIYHLDAKTAKLTPNDPPEYMAKVGSGPRAFRFHPNGKWAYCVNELDSTVTVLDWDAQNGVLAAKQAISNLPEGHTGPSAPSEGLLDKAGRFLYVANRLDDFMVTYAVSPSDGRLTLVERSSCGGKTPRHIALDPTERWLLIANQDSDHISVFARDAGTGKLAAAGKDFPLSKPQCVLFL